MQKSMTSFNPEVQRLRQLSRERKFRQRQRFVKRSWRVMWLLFGILVVEVIAAMLLSPRFWVYRLEVDGQVTLTRAEVIRLSGVKPGLRYNFFRAPLRDMEQAIGAEQRVERVAVTRKRLGVLGITVKEREPVCRLGYSTPPCYVDSFGIVFTRPAPPSRSLPVIEGVKTSSPEKMFGNSMRDEKVGGVLAAIHALNEAMVNGEQLDITRVVVGNNGQLTLWLKQGVEIIFGSPNCAADKSLAIGLTIKEAKKNGHFMENMKYIDVSFLVPATDIKARDLKTIYSMKDDGGAGTP